MAYKPDDVQLCKKMVRLAECDPDWLVKNKTQSVQIQAGLYMMESSQEALAVWEKVRFNELLVQYINYFFSIVTGMSLTQFAKSQFSSDILDAKRPDFHNLILYAACMFFVVSDWFFYHYLLTKYPYTHPLGVYRFGIDIFLFCLMYLLLYTATQSISLYRILLLMGTLLAWHLITQGWHIIKTFEHPKSELLFTHLYRSSGYGVLFIWGLIYSNMLKQQATKDNEKWEKNTLSLLIKCTTFLILYFNGTRLWYFVTYGPNPAPTLRNIDAGIVAIVGLLGLWYGIRLKRGCSSSIGEPTGSKA